MMKNYNYEDLVCRNKGFLSFQEQEKIKEAKILFAGCGLGSNTATLAARTGFSHFILADGDKVEVTNLNRQAFYLSHVGMNKAEATGQLIKDINNHAEIEILPVYITEKEAATVVSKADIIVNTVDPTPAVFAINRAANSQNKIVLFPLNIGFGGITLVFSPDSITLEEMVGGTVTEIELFLRIIETVQPYLPYITDYMKRFSEIKDDIIQGKQPGPQLGVGALVNASLIVTAMVKCVLGLPIKVTPETIAFDAWFLK